MALAPRRQRRLEIETAKARHTWAKKEFERAPTPALTKYLRESLDELAELRASNSHIDHPQPRGAITDDCTVV
jgi:hypothetical protein